jgi:hypothetical protein
VPIDIKKLLRTALDEVEREEQHDELESRFKALEERKPELRLGDLVSALENASDEELDALEHTVLADLVREARKEQETGAPPEEDGGAAGGGGGRAAPPPPEPRKRPGRRSGMAYDWWVDDDGRVTKLDVARVYTGEDEPEEVELPAEETA